VTTVAGDTPEGTILVVDDDPGLRRLLGTVLRGAGFGVIDTDDGDTVANLVREHHPDLVVLDLKMQRVSGLEALRALRQAGQNVGVIILTASGEDDLMVTAFEVGADDYVTKPFAPRVLLARVKALLRRARVDGADNQPTGGERVGEVSLDPLTHYACVAGHSVPLSPTEYHLLQTLMRGVGHVFTPADLLARVWGPSYAGQDEIVRANIYRLRHKVEPVPKEPRYIRSRPGVGYYFAERTA
jgi:DNA-binding response OmpR family regulator